jgi:hypothetical protein
MNKEDLLELYSDYRSFSYTAATDLSGMTDGQVSHDIDNPLSFPKRT